MSDFWANSGTARDARIMQIVGEAYADALQLTIAHRAPSDEEIVELMCAPAEKAAAALSSLEPLSIVGIGVLVRAMLAMTAIGARGVFIAGQMAAAASAEATTRGEA